MRRPKLTKTIVCGLLEDYPVRVEPYHSGFFIYATSDILSGCVLEDIVSLCNIFGCSWYVAKNEKDGLYVDLY